MPMNSTLKSPAAQNLIAAAVAGAGIFIRPARIPTWARRGLTVANTAGTAGSLLMSDKDGQTGGALGLKPVSGARNTTASAGSALAAAGGALSLITSGIGLKLDAKAENYLVKKGVKHPRLWMAIGAVGLVFIVKTVQDAATKKAEGAAAKFAESRGDKPAGTQLKQPAGKPSRAAATNSAVAPKRVAATPTETAGASKPEAGAGDVLDSAATSTAADVATAPSAARTAHADDTPIWTDVTKSAPSLGDNDSSAADDSGDEVAGDDIDTSALGHKPSQFEEQLAKTTVDDIDEPTPDVAEDAKPD